MKILIQGTKRVKKRQQATKQISSVNRKGKKNSGKIFDNTAAK